MQLVDPAHQRKIGVQCRARLVMEAAPADPRQRRLKDEPLTLEDLSNVYNVSRERIRQIEVRAFEKLQEKMHALATDEGMIELEPA